MKFRLKKLYQTLSKSIAAGTVKTVEEWTRIMPELWGSDLTKNFPDWFEKVSTLSLVTRAECRGVHVHASTVDKYRYDGKLLTGLSISANINSYEDVKELIDFLTVTKNCFIDKEFSVKTNVRVNPVTPKECFFPQYFPDADGRIVHEQDSVYTRCAAANAVIAMNAGYALRQGMKFFKSYASAIEYYGL